MSINSKYYSEDVKNIKRIDFSIFSNELVKSHSAVGKDPFGINVAESYDGYEPKKGGLVDLRLGTCDIYLRCTTCGLNSLDCPGHFGHTELAEPVFHYGFLNHLSVLLKCICLKCSNILLEKTEKVLANFANKSEKHRFKIMKDLVKNISYCPHCGTPVPKIKKEVKENSGSIKLLLEKEVGNVIVDDKTGINTETLKIVKEYLSPRECYYILRNVSEIDTFLLGFSNEGGRPEDLIMTRFPVPPVCIRPTAKIDFLASATMEDSLTLKISDIITSNIRVRTQMTKENLTGLQDINTLLQYHIATYFDNDSASLPTTTFKTGGKPTKSISDRLKAKEGRIRTNLMGKRVDFSARSVITSDPSIDIDEVGIPLKVAMELTIPEQVTPKNIDYLTKLVSNGRDTYPGANFIFKTFYIDGKEIDQRIDLKYRKKNIKLNYGDVVERQIVNGDYVLFNRQPTLHKPSMMGHRVHVLNRDDLNTFRMNVSVTGPYNADFDGDEMNIHLAQSFQARNELERIANVKYQIIGAKNSNPIIGCVQDSIAGAYILCKDMDIDKNLAKNLLCYTSTDINKIKIDENITGNKLFSYIIPDGINSLKKKDGDIFFQIKNGNLLKGTLDKSQVSTSKNSIIHYVWDKYGPDKTQKFIDDTQRLILNYLLNKGLTIGFKDIIVNDDILKNISELLQSKILLTKHNITQFENEKEQINLDIIEESLKSELTSVAADVGKFCIDSLDDKNGLKILVDSKSKGNTVQLAQMCGCIGQVVIEGVRVKKKVNGRTLPLFHKDDDTAGARGFVASSLLDGLKGHEFFFHTAAGREGLIDTAIKTADTGYIQRKLIKALEDLHVKYDGTIRTANDTIVQMLYGDSGIDQVKQTEVKVNIVNMNNDSIKKHFVFTDSELKKLEKNNSDIKNINKKLSSDMIFFRDELRKIIIKSTLNYKTLDDMLMLPVNLYRLTQEYSNNKEHFELNVSYIIEKLEKTLNNYDNRLLVLLKKEENILSKNEDNFKFIFRTALYEYISPKKCILEYGLSKTEFDNLINDIELSFNRSLVEPGEMVGIIAAQSIGEPTSQMTLNTKHSAGVASKSSANMGVPRIKEILSYSKKIKTPQTKIYFQDKYNKNKKDINKIASYFKHLTIEELIDSAEIFYDTFGNDEMSKLLVKDNTKNPFYINNEKIDISYLPFVFRLKMNLENMMDKETTLLDIKTKFITYWYKNFSNVKNMKKTIKDIIVNVEKLAISSNNNDIIHIRFRLANFNYNILTSFLKIVLNVITLKGIDNIYEYSLDQEMRVTFDENGNNVNDKEWVVTTSGINMSVLKTIKGIDFTRTRMNDVYHVYKYYGVEAARNILANELINTFAAGGSSVNYSHIALLVDFMTHTGDIISIDRHGLRKLDNAPLSKASFENTMDHFINAAIYNEKDNLKSVSSRVMVGRVISGGTGLFDVLLDTDKIKNSEFTQNEGQLLSSFTGLDKDPLFGDLIENGYNNIDFFIPE